MFASTDVFQYTHCTCLTTTAAKHEMRARERAAVCAFPQAGDTDASRPARPGPCTGVVLSHSLPRVTDVRSLLELPELRLQLRSGPALLDREVSRIYVTELPDPSRYLYAGELVLTGLLWWRGPGDAEPFVAALAEAGSAALAASGADTGGIPDDVIDACVRHDVPLLEVPQDLSFAVITERVVLALAGGSGPGTGGRTRLLSAAAEDPSLPTLLHHGSIELGQPCWLFSTTGRIIAASGAEPPDGPELATRFIRHGRGGLVVDGSYTVLPIAERSPVPWLLVVGGDSGHWGAGNLAVAEELAGLIELDRTRSAQLRELRDRVAAPLLRLATGGTLTEGELGAALTSTGLTEDTSVRVLLADTPGGSAAEAGEVLAELLAEQPANAMFGAAGSHACALVESLEWPSDWQSRTTDALEVLTPVLRADRVLLGIGGPSTVVGLRGAGEEARHALEAAGRTGQRVAVVSGEHAGMHQLLLAGAPDELRRSLRQRTIGPLLAYDAAQGTDLIRTVRVYLECSASPNAAAKALHVHVNTLRYRISRAGDLLGVDLGTFTNQVDIYLALRSED